MTKEGGTCEKECAREGVQVLFMDYLTCLGYNPPKASIRIIASSSSRLRGCYRLPFLDPSSIQRGKKGTDFSSISRFYLTLARDISPYAFVVYAT